MMILLHGIIVRGSYPENEAADSGMGREIVADQGGAKALRLEGFGHDPVADRGGKALGFEMEESR